MRINLFTVFVRSVLLYWLTLLWVKVGVAKGNYASEADVHPKSERLPISISLLIPACLPKTNSLRYNQT